MKARSILAGALLLLLTVSLAPAQVQDEVVLKATDGSSLQSRLTITSSTAGEHAVVRVESGSYLQLSTTNPGTNVAAGDIRYDSGTTSIKYYDGSVWKELASGSAVLFAPSSFQDYTGSNSLIGLNETGAGTPNLMELKVGGVDRFVITNSGQVRLLADDLFTDRWRSRDSMTVIGDLACGSNQHNTTNATVVGADAAMPLSSGQDITALGFRSLWKQNTGHRNTVAGGQWTAGWNTSGSDNTVFGWKAFYNNQTGSCNSALGDTSCYNTMDSDNTCVGTGAGYLCQGAEITYVGYAVAMRNSGSDRCVCVGGNAGYAVVNHNGPDNIYLGYNAGSRWNTGKKLSIAVSDTTNPLLYGELDNSLLRVNGRLEVEIASTNVAVFDRKTDDGVVVSICQDGVEHGTISVSGSTVSYNAFTGSHLCRVRGPVDRGALLAMTGATSYPRGQGRGEPVYDLAITTRANDPAVIGSFFSLQEPGKAPSDRNPHLVMSCGNGEIFVIDTGRDIEPGDPLVSSANPGHAMVDPGTYDTAHVVARAAERVRWHLVPRSPDGSRRKKISVLFDRFDLPGDPGPTIRSLEARIDEQDRKMKEMLGRLERSR